MKKFSIIIPFLLMVLACTALPWDSSSTSDTSTNSSSQPGVVVFTATPAEIAVGETATLMWNVTDATSVDIDHGVGSGLAVAGTIAVAPAATTVYTLTATGSSGSATASVTVSVTSSSSSSSSASTSTTPPPLRPNILAFDISPNTINIPPGAGPHQATMRWDVRNATAAYINNSPVALTGSRILKPSLGTHTYTLRAVNPAGEEIRTQVLKVVY